jgi:hypothetical protein
MSRKCKAYSEFSRDNPQHQNPLSKEAFAAGWEAAKDAYTKDHNNQEQESEVKFIGITDGFGSYWSKTCPQCGKDSMEVVRPGSCQCKECG